MTVSLPISFAERSHRIESLRMFARRPTQVAQAEHAHLPLHVQNPAVAFLSWTKADYLVQLAATFGEQHVWTSASAVYRDEAAARAVFEDRDVSVQIDSDALLFNDDLDQLLRATFAIDTGLSVEEFEAMHHNDYAYVKLFGAVELREVLRRRVIGWPRSLNEAERRKAEQLIERHCVVHFYKASQTRDLGSSKRYSASLDFKKFFQQFELIIKRYWAFKFGGRVYHLATIPTGAVLPPMIAQVLSRTLLAIAIRATRTHRVVESDCCIDNLRLCSDDLNALWITWLELLSLCEFLGATIGERTPPPVTSPTPYTYLGMSFVPHDAFYSVELSEKSKKKVHKAITLLESRSPMLVVDALAVFGKTVWACTVTNFPLGKLYHVIKFIRRIQRKSLADIVTVWNSIVDTWASSLKQMLNMKFIQQQKCTHSATMFTDACETGWGVVILDYGDRPIRVFAGNWSASEAKSHINELELRSFRVGARILASIKRQSEVIALHGFIDNTTARAWATKHRAPRYTANKLALQLQEEMHAANIQLLRLDYVPSAQNIADEPSRRTHDTIKSTGVRPMGEMGDGAARSTHSHLARSSSSDATSSNEAFDNTLVENQ